MQLLPKYGQNIIVGVTFNRRFDWYVTERDCWIMDLIKRQNDFTKNGFEYDMDDMLKFRFNIKIVDEATAGEYLNHLQEYKVPADRLRDLIVHKRYEDTVLSLNPSLLIDFDNKMLFSAYPENLNFEQYVPDGWVGKYANFLEFIPNDERYWIINGEQAIDKLYKQEVNEFMEAQNE